MKERWQGHYFDGISAARRAVTVVLTSHGLRIIKEDGSTLEWNFAETTLTQGFYEGEAVRLEKGGQALVINDRAFLDSLHAIAPGNFQGASERKKRGLNIALLFLGATVILAGLYLRGIPALAEYAAGKVPPEWEEKIGGEFAREFLKDRQECKGGKAGEAAEEMAAALDRAALPHPYRFKIHVVKSKTVNAFAFPGGDIVIFTGLIEAAKTPEELAGVLAHEIAHVLKKHTTKSVFESFSTYMLLSLVTGSTGQMTQIARAMGDLRYSRLHEKEADIEGMELLIKAGIDPKGLTRFMDTLKKTYGAEPEILAYVSSHPLTDERAAYLKKRLKTVKREFTPLLPGVRWEEVKKGCGD